MQNAIDAGRNNMYSLQKTWAIIDFNRMIQNLIISLAISAKPIQCLPMPIESDSSLTFSTNATTFSRVSLSQRSAIVVHCPRKANRKQRLLGNKFSI